MSVLTLEGLVENGQIRLLDGAVLPDKTRVYVVVPGAEQQTPRIWSPRLADRQEASQFTMEVTELCVGGRPQTTAGGEVAHEAPEGMGRRVFAR